MIKQKLTEKISAKASTILDLSEYCIDYAENLELQYFVLFFPTIKTMLI